MTLAIMTKVLLANWKVAVSPGIIPRIILAVCTTRPVLFKPYRSPPNTAVISYAALFLSMYFLNAIGVPDGLSPTGGMLTGFSRLEPGPLVTNSDSSL